jgi:hypothetical protein
VDVPFEVHQLLFQAVYSGWDRDRLGPPPVWVPSREEVADTNLARFMAGFRVRLPRPAQLPQRRQWLPAAGSRSPPEASDPPRPQGDLAWLQQRSGDPARDLPLLQRVSCDNPEGYWAAVLQQLRVSFQKPPHRWAAVSGMITHTQLSPGGGPPRCRASLAGAWQPLHHPSAAPGQHRGQQSPRVLTFDEATTQNPAGCWRRMCGSRTAAGGCPARGSTSHTPR